MSSAPDAPRQVSWLSFRVLSMSFCERYLLWRAAALQVRVMQLRLELKNARDDGVFVRNRCSTVRYGCAQFLELRRDPIAAFTAAEHQLTAC